jgi:hypothetical protein
MTLHDPVIGKIHDTFSRHDRKYCLFSVAGRDDDLLYYSHRSKPLRSLMFGKDFTGHIPALVRENDSLCIECGLGLAVAGGVALDNGDLLAWNFSAEEANRILAALRDRLGKEGSWIVLF